MDVTDTQVISKSTSEALTEECFNTLALGQIVLGGAENKHQPAAGEEVRWRVTNIIEDLPLRLVVFTRLGRAEEKTDVVKLVKWSSGPLDVTVDVLYPRYAIHMKFFTA